MVGMWPALSQLEHSRAHGLGFRLTLLQPRVEADHEVLGTLIVDVPETQDERLPAGLQQSSNQAHEFISRAHDVQAGGAAAQHNQIGRQPQLRDLAQIQMRAAQPNR